MVSRCYVDRARISDDLNNGQCSIERTTDEPFSTARLFKWKGNTILFILYNRRGLTVHRTTKQHSLAAVFKIYKKIPPDKAADYDVESSLKKMINSALLAFH